MISPNALAVRDTKGQVTGFIDGETYTRHVSGSKHMLRKPQAWCFDADSFDKLIRPSCRQIVVEDLETRKRYHSTMVNFIAERGEIDRGYGRQYFMILSKWRLL